jgi:UDP-N-acetylglucosamine:LPS N-acetylglucosamine transferase
VSSPSREDTEGQRKHRLLLVASSGGHLYELVCLRDFWQDKDRVWVSFPTADARSLLACEACVHWAAFPTTRNLPNLLRNLVLALRVIHRERPTLVLSTGAGVAVPFFWVARLFGIPAVYVESIARIDGLSLTGKLLRPFASRLLVQWPELADRERATEYHGRVA